MSEALTPASDPTLDNLQSWLAGAAEKVGLSAVDAPELTGNIFMGGDATASARLASSELPSPVRALRIGRYTLLLSMLPQEPSLGAVNEALRRFRNQCVVLRSFLSANEVLDVQGILVGPRGSERVDDWGALALLVERDDRVARKFVWLRPADEAADHESLADLVKRTFLARPWVNDSTFTMAALDNLNRAAAMWDASVPRDTVDQWVKLSLGPRDDADGLVDGLVAAWSRRGVS